MSFIRVRGARPGDPLHEYDIPTVMFERHPDRYKVIDKKPVVKQRPASHIPGVVKASKPRKAAPKTGEETKGRVRGSSDSPSGADPKE